MERVDVLFTAHSRFEFTYLSLLWLIRTLEVDRVNQLWIVDDSSDVETRNFLEMATSFVLKELVDVQFKHVDYNSMSLVVADFIDATTADIMCKIDNDLCIMEAGWLSRLLNIMNNRLELCCLGITNPVIESIYKDKLQKRHYEQGYIEVNYIGGIGLFRKNMFNTQKLRQYTKGKGYYGMANAQGRIKKRKSGLKKGWCIPFVTTELLDRCDNICSRWNNSETLQDLCFKYTTKGHTRKR